MRVLALGLLVVVVLTTRGVHAETPTGAVALLPLDADRDLELYGQPVAGEIARALVAGGIKVVIVGPKMAVPEGVRLVVDGTIKAGKGDSVTLLARVRDPRDGTIVDTFAVVAPMHTAIDHAAEELSAHVVPSVLRRLTPETTPEAHVEKHVTRPPPAPVRHPMLVAVASAPGEPQLDVLRTAFGAVTAPWAQRRHHDATLVDGRDLLPAGSAAEGRRGVIDALTLTDDQSSRQVNAAGADLAVVFDVQTFTVASGLVPTARATVRVRVVDPNHVVFDRVVVTDTVVGERGLLPGWGDQAKLAERVARQVLDIVEPHLKRSITSWR